MNPQLIFFEGILGSGKTTMSNMLYEHLKKKNIDVNVYLEAQEYNAINLAGYACLTRQEFDLLCKHFRNESFENVVYLKNYCFIQYAVSKRNLYQGKLLEYLRENEFCYTSNPRVDRRIL